MQTLDSLSRAFGPEFQNHIGHFLVENKLLDSIEDLSAKRFLTRSVAPHIEKLSGLFNRQATKQNEGLNPYWKESSNPVHLRLAYFLYFMPCNLYRVASVVQELARLGYTSKSDLFRGIEFGAGPASGACGVAASEISDSIGLPKSGHWALIEQDQAMLRLGSAWARSYFDFLSIPDWSIRSFHRTLDLKKGFLPRTAPQFNFWLMSFFLNEFEESEFSIAQIAESLFASWENHLESESLIVMVEPALKDQSRRLLELRKHLIQIFNSKNTSQYKILLPCLGHQNCGALEAKDDWCHEDVSWWRPPYIKQLDEIVSLDRKSLPFSYLVIAKSPRSRAELLPRVGTDPALRLVSPTHKEGRDKQFYVCGEAGKQKARLKGISDPEFGRGTILKNASARGDKNSLRIQEGVEWV